MNMKRLLITCLVAGISLAGMKAGFSQAQLAIGVKGGLNFANVSADSQFGEQYKSRTGFHAGAFGLIKLTKIGIQPEIIFSQQGSKIEFNSEELTSNFSYVNIPILLKLYTVAGINLQAGPQFGFVTSAKQETFDEFGDITTEDVKDQIKGSDISIGLGLGWDLPFGLTLDARYNLGLSKINEDAPSASDKAKNQVIQVSVGYKLIKLGK